MVASWAAMLPVAEPKLLLQYANFSLRSANSLSVTRACISKCSFSWGMREKFNYTSTYSMYNFLSIIILYRKIIIYCFFFQASGARTSNFQAISKIKCTYLGIPSNCLYTYIYIFFNYNFIQTDQYLGVEILFGHRWLFQGLFYLTLRISVINLYC